MSASCDASTPYYQEFIAVAESLRCPVCEGQRVASSDAPFALTVKEDICGFLHQGLSAEQTIARIETSYGADLHVEDDASAAMLPLVATLIVLCALGMWKVRRVVR